MLVGGGVFPEGAEFGDDFGLIPARRAPEAVKRLLAHAKANAQNETPAAYLRRVDKDDLKPLIADLVDLDAEVATENDFWDIGATEAFLGEATGEGECAA
jgi:hypothetical protein